jgi:hypothetical protein
MFHYLDKYARDDAIVKAVFDHVRNIGLAAVVLAAAIWKDNNAGPGMGLVAIYDHVAATALAFCAIGLLWMNHENLFHKVRNTSASKWLKLLFAILYTMAFIELLRFLRQGRIGS